MKISDVLGALPREKLQELLKRSDFKAASILATPTGLLVPTKWGGVRHAKHEVKNLRIANRAKQYSSFSHYSHQKSDQSTQPS